jgi:phosphatidylinositol kinase/protein kinase (PI-3  family)
LLYLETISKGNEQLACFNNDPQEVTEQLRQRFFPHMNDHAAEQAVQQLVDESLDHWTTNVYDKYQRLWQGIH